MKVQEIDTSFGRRWILVNNEYEPISEVNQYLKFLDSIGRTENTLRTYAYALKLYCEFLSLRGLSITEIADDDKRPLDILAEFLVWLRHPSFPQPDHITFLNATDYRSPKTINTILGIVLSFYDYMGKNHLCNPLDAYKNLINMSSFKPFLYEMVQKKHRIKVSLFRMKEPKKDLQYITAPMFEQMINSCRLWRDKAIISIMFEGGLRLGETLGLRISDIEVWNNRINVVSRDDNENHCKVKNKAEGAVYVGNRTMEFIASYFMYERENIKCDYVFINLFGKRKGKPMQTDTVEKMFDRISIKLGESIHPHMCRHGCATLRLEAGWDEPSIQRQLRHVNISTTKMYEHYEDELLLKKTKELMLSQHKKFGWSETDGLHDKSDR